MGERKGKSTVSWVKPLVDFYVIVCGTILLDIFYIDVKKNRPKYVNHL